MKNYILILIILCCLGCSPKTKTQDEATNEKSTGNKIESLFGASDQQKEKLAQMKEQNLKAAEQNKKLQEERMNSY